MKAMGFESLLAAQHQNKVIRAKEQEKMGVFQEPKGGRAHFSNQICVGFNKRSTVENELSVLWTHEERYGMTN